jgi:hypothetical protein
MSFAKIDHDLLSTITGGATQRQQITDRLNTEADHAGIGGPTSLRVKCGPSKSGTQLCHGSFQSMLGAGGGFQNSSYQAVFEKGSLKHLQTKVTGGD